MKNEGEKELRERLMQYLLTRRDTGYPLDETCFDFFWAYIVELEARKEGEINKLHETIELYSEGQENFENWQVDVSAYKEKVREMIDKQIEMYEPAYKPGDQGYIAGLVKAKEFLLK